MFINLGCASYGARTHVFAVKEQRPNQLDEESAGWAITDLNR